MNAQHNHPLADRICDLTKRKIKKTFFTQINTLLDYGKISKVINAHYKTGTSAAGCRCHDGLVLFKICLL